MTDQPHRSAPWREARSRCGSCWLNECSDPTHLPPCGCRYNADPNAECTCDVSCADCWPWASFEEGGYAD